MKTANQILHEEGAKGKHFGLLSGTVPTIERAMEVYAEQQCCALIRYMNYDMNNFLQHRSEEEVKELYISFIGYLNFMSNK